MRWEVACLSWPQFGAVFSAGYLHHFLRSEYISKREIYLAHPGLLWTTVLADAVTAFAYMLSFVGICWLVYKTKHIPQIKPYLWLAAAFRIFLLAGSAALAVRIASIWLPFFQFFIVFKTLGAVAAAPSAMLFAWRAPAIARNGVRFFDLLRIQQEQSEALRKSEEFLDRTNQLAGVGGWEVDLRTQEVSWSAETYRIHGAPLDYKPTLKQGLAFYTPESRPLINAAVEAAFMSGKEFDLELSMVRLDGTLVWVRSKGAAEFHAGSPIRLGGAFQDITAQVAERAALKEANDRVTLATDSGGIGTWDWNIPAGTLRCDAWMHRLHGIEPSDAPPDMMRWREQLHPEDRVAVERAMQDAVEGVSSYDTEFRVIWPDGSTHFLRAAAQVSRDADGRARNMVGANWDVTEARRLTAALAEQHELLRVTLASIGDGVITTDAEGKVVWLNAVAERLTGWTAAEAAGLPLGAIFIIVNTDTRLPVENPVAISLASAGPATLAPETILIRRDGVEFGIEDSAAPILSDKGKLLGAVLVFHDVTEQRRLSAEARDLARIELKLKDEFLSNVSHELRSPLTSIYSFSSIIADGLAGATSVEQQEFLGIILKNVDQLRAMIEDLLTVTQAREGKLRIEPEVVSVSEAVEDAVNIVQGPAERKHIRLAWDLSACQLSAFADPRRLRQILIILLDNAVKFTPESGSVRVSASLLEESILLRVIDSGCGIPADKRQRIFEHLYQVEQQPDTSQAGRTGLGLGLHIANDLVTRQGGTIWVDDAEGTGSVFSFTLPLRAPAEVDGTHLNECAAVTPAYV